MVSIPAGWVQGQGRVVVDLTTLPSAPVIPPAAGSPGGVRLQYFLGNPVE